MLWSASLSLLFLSTSVVNDVVSIVITIVLSINMANAVVSVVISIALIYHHGYWCGQCSYRCCLYVPACTSMYNYSDVRMVQRWYRFCMVCPSMVHALVCMDHRWYKCCS